MFNSLRLGLIVSVLFSLHLFIAGDAMGDKPNIIIIYADDLGFGDLSCYNDDAAYQTPRLDQMAQDGIQFTDAHSPSTICSPSRYDFFLVSKSTDQLVVAEARLRAPVAPVI